MQNTQSYYEIYSILLPMCMVATAVKHHAAIAVEILGVTQILIPNMFFNYMRVKLISQCVIPLLEFWLLYRQVCPKQSGPW
jgi:hypothetical protein